MSESREWLEGFIGYTIQKKKDKRHANTHTHENEYPIRAYILKIIYEHEILTVKQV